jgi:hypothetical protein
MHMPEAARLARGAVHGDGRGDDFAARGEFGGEPVVVDVPRELADKDGFYLFFAFGSRDGGGVAVGELDLFGGRGVVCGGFALAWGVMSVGTR